MLAAARRPGFHSGPLATWSSRRRTSSRPQSARRQRALCERALPREHRYLALVGSERKARLTRQRCLNKGIDEARVAAMRSPAGLDIGAETPEEIAISIVAEMVRVRRRMGAETESTLDERSTA